MTWLGHGGYRAWISAASPKEVTRATVEKFVVEGSEVSSVGTNLSLWSIARHHIFKYPLNDALDLRQERSRIALPRCGVGDDRVFDDIIVSGPN